MAAVPVNMDVVIYPKGRAGGDQPFAAFITGVAWRSDVGIGGGPIFPPEQPPGGGNGHPEHPIVPPGGYPHPEHPIVLPDPPVPPDPPTDLPDPLPPSSVVKEAPAGGGWGYYSDANSSLYAAYRPSGAGPKR